MKKFLLPTLIMLGSFVFTHTVSEASNLEISNTSDFSILSTNFNGGETIYVRTTAENDGSDKSLLNLRDNSYSLINSFNLVREGSYFTKSITAPAAIGYYSLEARVESGGSSSTSVKTIKVGAGSSANIKVNVNNQVEGEKVNSESNLNLEPASPTPIVEYLESSDDTVYDYDIRQKSFAQNMVSIAKLVLDFLWPF